VWLLSLPSVMLFLVFMVWWYGVVMGRYVGLSDLRCDLLSIVNTASFEVEIKS